MSENKEQHGTSFRVVPIEKDVRMGEQISGEEYYRSRGDTVIQEVEIVSEKPLETNGEGVVFRKTSDVQQAAYQVERPSQYDAFDAEEPEALEDDEAHVFTNAAQSRSHADKAVKRKSGRGASRPPKLRRWYQSPWLYACLGAVVLIALGVLYAVSDADYRAQSEQIAARASQIVQDVQNGSEKKGATIEDELDFYTDLSHEAQLQNRALAELNERFWWIIGRADAADVGLAALNEQMDELTPLLVNLDVFMQQVSQVVDQVLGTKSAPGHLLQALELSSAQQTLEQDRDLIANALVLCDELEQLPESFAKGKANLERQLRDLDADVALLQTYLTELSALSGQTDLFCAAARDHYARTPADRLGADLQAQNNVIVRSDSIQSAIVQINEQEHYRRLHRFYGISDFPLDEAGRQMLAEEGVVQTARNIILTIRQEDESLASAGADASLCQTMLESNASYVQQLQELELPPRYSVGVQRYLNALEMRRQYLEAYLVYAKAIAQANAHQANVESLKTQRDTLKGQIAAALDSGDMELFRQKTQEWETVSDQLDDEREAYNAAFAQAQPLLQQANKLHTSYSELAD